MARLPDAEIERLRSSVDLVRLIEADGLALKRTGKDWACACPFHDGDREPSLIVSPAKNLFHCFACGAAGSPIDWVMRRRGVAFRRAVELLRESDGGQSGLAGEGAVPRVAAAKIVAPLTATEDDAALLDDVVGFYHATLRQSPEAQAYLASRGLTHPDLIDHFRLGYANRTLAYRLPHARVQSGAAVRQQLQRLGVVRASGHEHLNGSLVVPVIAAHGRANAAGAGCAGAADAAGAVRGLYGRKIAPPHKLTPGTPLHLYLPGPHRGVFNEAGLIGQEEVILCEALLDALTFWCAGYRNVTSAYGVEGFTDDMLDAFQRHGTKRVLIAYDADVAGNTAAEKLAVRLMAAGLECYRCRFPKGLDANQYALDVTPAAKSLGLVIRQAEWLGKGAAPARTASTPVVAPVVEVPSFAAEVLPSVPDVVADAALPALPTPPAYRVPPSEPALPVEIDDKELRLTLGDRTYAVRAIEKNLSYEQLKVWIKAQCAGFVHVDTVELYQAKQRSAWVKQAAIELGLSEDAVKADLGKLLRAVEQRQDALIRQRLKPGDDRATDAPALTPAQHDAALALLRDPLLMQRIVADVSAIGVVGEDANALVGYLACVSRKLDKPLAVLIQSTSAAGKSTLMDALLSLMPEPERVHYSAMTGQSLFYLGEGDLRHKILAIAEEEGVRQAAYALKLLQSQGELTIASTGKDPVTGKLVTEEYRVEGPVMLFLTTTAIDLDEELLNRCLVLTINETREQTEAIHRRQREARTLQGLLASKHSAAILALHQAAQSLLRPLAVVNPYAEALTFRSESTRMRRDHAKYLTLIDAIAFLHQYQRPVQSLHMDVQVPRAQATAWMPEVEQCMEQLPDAQERPASVGGEVVEYVEVTLDDIALANRLAHDVLGRSLDALPPQTRRVLGLIVAHVAAVAQQQALPASAVRFTRKDVRSACGVTDTALRLHLERLVEMEYLLVHRGGFGARFVYELVYDGDAQAGDAHVVGLIDVEALRQTSHPSAPTSQGVSVNLAPTSHPENTPLAPTSQGHTSPRNASAGAGSSSLVAAAEETAVLRRARVASHRSCNGAAVAGR